jgi:hypothetical protein
MIRAVADMTGPTSSIQLCWPVSILAELIGQILTILVLPSGCEVESVEDHGKTNWSTGYKVEVLLPNGDMKAYFMKVMEALGVSLCNRIIMPINSFTGCGQGVGR